MADLFVPDLPEDCDTLTAALAYAAAGWYVLPIRRNARKNPGSVVGKQWQHQSSREPEVIAAWFAGTDHGIALHLGRSGAVAFDVDYPDRMPGILADSLELAEPPIQTTRIGGDPGRGHYVFAMPTGRILGNGTGKLGGAWGEIRGKKRDHRGRPVAARRRSRRRVLPVAANRARARPPGHHRRPPR